MYQLLQYYGRWQGFKGKAAQLPSWARFILLIAAIPGVLLIVLSILAFLVSLLALLLLTIPLYRVLCVLCGVKSGSGMSVEQSGFGPVPEGMDVVVEQAGEPTVVATPMDSEPTRPRRQIEVKIVE